MQLIYTTEATDGLDYLHRYIAQTIGLPDTADRVLQAIYEIVGKAATPETREMGHLVTSGTRRLRTKNCTILYTSTADQFVVISIRYERYARQDTSTD
jgi:plasmid stabilization system protein ParE